MDPASTEKQGDLKTPVKSKIPTEFKHIILFLWHGQISGRRNNIFELSAVN